MSNIHVRVAARAIQAARFEVDGQPFDELYLAAQEAEFAHSDDGQPHQVLAVVDDEHGMFSAGEVVYTSKGAPE